MAERDLEDVDWERESPSRGEGRDQSYRDAFYGPYPYYYGGHNRAYPFEPSQFPSPPLCESTSTIFPPASFCAGSQVGSNTGVCEIECTSQNKTRVSLAQKQMFNYRVKIINPKKKCLYNMKSLHQDEKFATLNDLKEYVEREVGEFQGTVGYIEPGHGTKGKMRQLSDDEDLSDMYVLHKRKQDVLLWVYGETEGCTDDAEAALPCKRPCSDSPAPSSRRESIAKTISNVETIIGKLKEKHGEDGFSVEKFNCWAHMINSGKWSSYDMPPDFPFFKKPKGKDTKQRKEKNHSDGTDKSSCTSEPVAGSPTKRLNMRTQCIEQLSKWHVLLEAGAISQAQYDELKGIILDDIKNM